MHFLKVLILLLTFSTALCSSNNYIYNLADKCFYGQLEKYDKLMDTYYYKDKNADKAKWVFNIDVMIVKIYGNLPKSLICKGF